MILQQKYYGPRAAAARAAAAAAAAALASSPFGSVAYVPPPPLSGDRAQGNAADDDCWLSVRAVPANAGVVDDDVDAVILVHHDDEEGAASAVVVGSGEDIDHPTPGEDTNPEASRMREGSFASTRVEVA